MIASAIALSLVILELVRRRRLREEYSWLWILAAIVYTLAASWPGFGLWLARFLGSSNPVSAFAFLGLGFLLLICVQFSVQISRLTEQNKNLMQQLAILDGEFKALAAQQDDEQTEPEKEEETHAQRSDHRPGRLVPGVDEHEPAGETLARV
ncbi:MAG: DUF2304 domain-containing protein [Anaerolineaceae bacterium]|nr:DUF2304 domain-containing protein [Anaerolineaceae bacterium]